jgi:hypothetical protein
MKEGRWDGGEKSRIENQANGKGKQEERADTPVYFTPHTAHQKAARKKRTETTEERWQYCGSCEGQERTTKTMVRTAKAWMPKSAANRSNPPKRLVRRGTDPVLRESHTKAKDVATCRPTARPVSHHHDLTEAHR